MYINLAILCLFEKSSVYVYIISYTPIRMIKYISHCFIYIYISSDRPMSVIL